MPEIGVIAATRGMLGAGAALLLADRMPEQRRKRIGLALLVTGVVSTFPLVIDVIRKSRVPESPDR